jgi:hypothetical protein
MPPTPLKKTERKPTLSLENSFVTCAPRIHQPKLLYCAGNPGPLVPFEHAMMALRRSEVMVDSMPAFWRFNSSGCAAVRKAGIIQRQGGSYKQGPPGKREGRRRREEGSQTQFPPPQNPLPVLL